MGPRNKVSVSAMDEQLLLLSLPIPSFCILHKSLFARSRRSGHTPKHKKEMHIFILKDSRLKTNPNGNHVSFPFCILSKCTCRVGPSPGATSSEGKRSTNASTASILWMASCSASSLFCSASDSWLRDTTMSFSCSKRLADCKNGIWPEKGRFV